MLRVLFRFELVHRAQYHGFFNPSLGAVRQDHVFAMPSHVSFTHSVTRQQASFCKTEHP